MGVEGKVSSEAWATVMSRLLVTSKENNVSTLVVRLTYRRLRLFLPVIKLITLCPSGPFYSLTPELRLPSKEQYFVERRYRQVCKVVAVKTRRYTFFFHEVYTSTFRVSCLKRSISHSF